MTWVVRRAEKSAPSADCFGDFVEFGHPGGLRLKVFRVLRQRVTNDLEME